MRLLYTPGLLQDGRPSRLCENVTSEGKTRQKQARKRSLLAVNEHSEPVFNAVLPNAVVFTQPADAPVLLVRSPP
ncbi:hypothetical protein DWF74_29490 [Pseudomonas protegens]|nr:hypothetical protein DWF74_29490 [Pseudomonas protegens]